MYIHQLHDWPRFNWNQDRLAQPLASVRYRQGRMIGHMEALGFEFRQEAVLHTLSEDVLKSTEIEGERLDAAQVRSSPLPAAWASTLARSSPPTAPLKAWWK